MLSASKVRLFADYYLITGKNRQDQIRLQKYLNLFENWGNTWFMRFQDGKCNIMQVSPTHNPTFKQLIDMTSSEVLEEVMDTKYLGITFRNDLDWSKYTSTMITKLAPSFSFVPQPEGLPREA